MFLDWRWFLPLRKTVIICRAGKEVCVLSHLLLPSEILRTAFQYMLQYSKSEERAYWTPIQVKKWHHCSLFWGNMVPSWLTCFFWLHNAVTHTHTHSFLKQHQTPILDPRSTNSNSIGPRSTTPRLHLWHSCDLNREKALHMFHDLIDGVLVVGSPSSVSGPMSWKPRQLLRCIGGRGMSRMWGRPKPKLWECKEWPIFAYAWVNLGDWLPVSPGDFDVLLMLIFSLQGI